MKTLLTHEWMRTRSMLGAVAGIAVLVVGVSILMTFTGWPVISDFGFLLGVITIAVLVPALQLLLVADFWRSSYSRTGYYTHSLPIRGGKIYAAKLIWAFAVTLLGLIVSLALLGAFWPAGASLSGNEANPFVVAGDMWAQLTTFMPIWLLIGMGLLFLAMYLVWPIQYYFAVSIGSEGWLNKLGLGGPVVVFVALYMATQLGAVLGFLAIPFGIGVQDGTFGLMSYNLIQEIQLGAEGTEEVLPIGFLPVFALIAALCLVRTVWSWNRKISLA